MKKTIILIIFAFIATIISNDSEYVNIPSTSIRMRVIAASNSHEDQNNKKIIKGALEQKLYEITSGKESYEEIDKVIEDKKESIDVYIEQILIDNGINNSFISSYGYNFFPEKEYKGLTYEAGNYKSYVITLGEGKGENWWCVLFPPICLIDDNVSDYEYHFLIKDTLEKYN